MVTSLFGKSGTVDFTQKDILINGEAAPGGADAQIVLYDTVPERPVQCVWQQDGTFLKREFTSDIIARYR